MLSHVILAWRYRTGGTEDACEGASIKYVRREGEGGIGPNADVVSEVA